MSGGDEVRDRRMAHVVRPQPRRPSAAKRLFDILVSSVALLSVVPLLVVASLFIWLDDHHRPLYLAPRVGWRGRPFRMVKLRSMVVGADQKGGHSTAKNDTRITRVGRVIRRFKLDELGQLWNVLRGDMSLVGPRPNLERDVQTYTSLERGLLEVRPGITDFASVVFADEGDILNGAADPDLLYTRVIRPWKSRLGLHYVAVQSFGIDVRLVLVTIVNSFSRRLGLRWVVALLQQTGAHPQLVEVARRSSPLAPAPPPAVGEVVDSRVTPSPGTV